jgi:tetratricopeptide (TPR) repeat protein
MLTKEEYNAFKGGKNLLDMGNYLEAIAELDRVIALNPNNMEAVNLRDQAKNKLEEQSLLLAQKEKEKSEDIQSLFNSAVEEYSKYNYKLAISKWQKVLAIDPTREDAKSYIEKAEKKNNERISSLLNQLNSKIKRKDWLSVVSIAGKIKSFDPANKKAQAAEKNAETEINSLVQLNLKKAKDYYKQTNLFSSEEYFRIVLRYDQKNKEAKAYIKSIEKSKKKEDSDKWYLKGIDAYTKNQYKLAISYWNRCLSIDPSYDKARKNIGRANKKLAELGE